MHRWVLTDNHQIKSTLSISHSSTCRPRLIPAAAQAGLWALLFSFYMLVHVACTLWFKWLLEIRESFLLFSCLFLPLPLSLSHFFPFSLPLFLVQCSLSVIIPIIRLSVCLSFCLSVWLLARSFCSSVYSPTACNSLSSLKRKNRNSVSFSFCGKNSNGNNWQGHVFWQKD